MNIAYRASSTDRRLGLLLTALVHVALVIAWQAVRTLPAPVAAADSARSRLLWIPLPLPLPARRDKEAAAPPREAAAQPAPQRPGSSLALPPQPQLAAPPSVSTAEAASAPAASTIAPEQAAPVKPSAEQILQQARRDIGGIAKALRKENKPYIAAPLDSPQIRMRRGMEQAAAMAPNRIWEAPKVEELVNNTGDGARRSRVITGNGTYCVTERATNTNVEMIEMHGKIRLTNCPAHEEPSRQQEWRTLRD
jgi:hypothetical protein